MAKPTVTNPTTGRAVTFYGGDDSQARVEHPAAEEDRRTRAAWGRPLRSPYLSLTRIPEDVAMGDHAEAAAIVRRIDAALAHGEGGLWTPAERNRLRGQRKAWARRASGEDVVFNLCGWKKKQDFKRPGEYERLLTAHRVARIVGGFREEIEASAKGAGTVYEQIRNGNGNGKGKSTRKGKGQD